MKITTEQENITPKQAEEILARHYERIASGEFKQRPVFRSIILKYAADMKADHWDVTPEPIIFDENGNLSDGQHRLEAVRLSGKTVEFTVTRGWPAGVINNIGGGKSRTVANKLYLNGQPNAFIFASSVNCLARVAYRGDVPPISYRSAIHILDALDMRKHIDRMIDITSPIRRSGRFIGPLAFYRSVAPKKADEFMNRIVTLELDKDTGPAVFARYMRERTVNDQGDAVRALCTCIKLWHEGETVAHLRGGGLYGVDYVAGLNKKLAESIRGLLGSTNDTTSTR